MNKTSFSIIDDKSDDTTCRLILKGPANAATADILKRKLDEVLKTGCKRIILNMQEVPFLASVGIRVLLMFYKISSGRGIGFFIENPSDNVKNVLGMVALDEMLLK